MHEAADEAANASTDSAALGRALEVFRVLGRALDAALNAGVLDRLP